jgi:hypothetical protein
MGYSPIIGRFLQRDPIEYAGGINLYEFVGSNPPNYVDPYGLARPPTPGSVDWINARNQAAANRAPPPATQPSTQPVTPPWFPEFPDGKIPATVTLPVPLTGDEKICGSWELLGVVDCEAKLTFTEASLGLCAGVKLLLAISGGVCGIITRDIDAPHYRTTVHCETPMCCRGKQRFYGMTWVEASVDWNHAGCHITGTVQTGIIGVGEIGYCQ